MVYRVEFRKSLAGRKKEGSCKEQHEKSVKMEWGESVSGYACKHPRGEIRDNCRLMRVVVDGIRRPMGKALESLEMLEDFRSDFLGEWVGQSWLDTNIERGNTDEWTRSCGWWLVPVERCRRWCRGKLEVLERDWRRDRYWGLVRTLSEGTYTHCANSISRSQETPVEFVKCTRVDGDMSNYHVYIHPYQIHSLQMLTDKFPL